jgi:DNA-binding MarR family transcriptional regulator
VLSDKNDKRNKILALTEKGTEYTQLTAEISKELVGTFYKGFSDEEKQQFFEFLKRIEKNF